MKDLEFEDLKQEVLDLEEFNEAVESFRKATKETADEYLLRELNSKGYLRFTPGEKITIFRSKER